MRIIGGALGGRPIRAPAGETTRPTSDRARQAVFNVLEHAAWSPGLEGSRVLDGFCGSGALGLEALSRGGAFCLFMDRAPEALGAVAANLGALGLGADRARMQRADVTQPGANPGAAFGLVFLDPPYRQGFAEPALTALAGGGWLAEEALCVVERAAGETAPEFIGFERLDSRRYGAAAVAFLRFNG